MVRVAFVGLIFGLSSVAVADDGKPRSLKENSAGRTFRVEVKVSVKGNLQTALPGKEAAREMPLVVDATLNYRERSLPGRGRDALALRSFRRYDKADASISVAGHKTKSALRKIRQSLVAQGALGGVDCFSLQGPLSFAEAELLSHPGDTLALQGLLPGEDVEVGDDWRPDDWAVQMFAGLDALLKHDIKCEFSKVKDGRAEVVFKGPIEGAHLGSSVKMNVSGVIGFDVDSKSVSAAAITITDKRSIGSVTPGLDVTASISLTRQAAADNEPIADKDIQNIALNPPKVHLKLASTTPWGVRFVHDREWHVFKQAAQVAVVRLIQNGNLVAQFNAAPVPRGTRGRIASMKDFQADIKKALGDRVRKIESEKTLDLAGKIKAHQVIVDGASNKIEMRWIYYLVANGDGRQTAFVFAVEKKLAKDLGDAHESIVKSVEFMPLPTRISGQK